MCSPEKIPGGGVAIGKKRGLDSEGKSRNVSSPILSLSLSPHPNPLSPSSSPRIFEIQDSYEGGALILAHRISTKAYF